MTSDLPSHESVNNRPRRRARSGRFEDEDEDEDEGRGQIWRALNHPSVWSPVTPSAQAELTRLPDGSSLWDMIYILPGMGADSTMFRAEWRDLEDAVFLDWPRYSGEASLTEVARRIVTENDIPDGSVVVGHSLGGMVSCEIARIRKLRQLILVGSASRKEGVSSLLAKLHPLAAHTPFEFVQSLAARLPLEVAEMFCRSEPDFIRAACKAIFEWDGLHPDVIRPKRIHGLHDRVIPPPPEADFMLNGGHMIPVTHAAECVSFIRSVL